MKNKIFQIVMTIVFVLMSTITINSQEISSTENIVYLNNPGSINDNVVLGDLSFVSKEVGKQLKNKIKEQYPNGKLFYFQGFNNNGNYVAIVTNFKTTEAYLFYYSTDLNLLDKKEFEANQLKSDFKNIQI